MDYKWFSLSQFLIIFNNWYWGMKVLSLIFSFGGEICKTINTTLVLMSLLLIFNNRESVEKV